MPLNIPESRVGIVKYEVTQFKHNFFKSICLIFLSFD